jgi:type IV pilus biogenesis/stability protein PilW
MKICPFISHMIGEDRTDILQIDGSSPAPKKGKASSKKKGGDEKDVVILGYDGGDSAVGVQTKPAKTKKSDQAVPSHLFCLKDTCRFYVKKSSECKFDSILDATQEHSKKIDQAEKNADQRAKQIGSVEGKIAKLDTVDDILKKITSVEAQLKKAESGKTDKGADKATAIITKDLDKFWKFQTKSVAELIASIGETEKKQEQSFAQFKQDLDKSVDGWKPEVDLSPIGELKGEIEKLKSSVESREDGIESFSTTVSELVLNIDDTLKNLQTKNELLADRIEKLETSLPKPEELQKKIEIAFDEKLHNVGGSEVADEIQSLGNRFQSRVDDLLGAHKRIEDHLESWRETLESRVRDLYEHQESWKGHLERLEEKQTEVMELIKDDRERLEDESTRFRAKEAKKFNNLGVTSFHNGEFELARDQFLEAVELDPRFAESWNNLGLVYTELQDEDRATEAFSKAVEINPDLPAAYNNLGYIFYKQGSYDQAIEMYNEALGRSSDNSSAYTNLGNAYFKQGNREEARKAWEKALEIDPGNEKASLNLKRLDKE